MSEESVDFFRVLPEYIDRIWPKVEPFLKKGVDASRGRFDMPSLYREITTGAQHLWIFVKDDDEVVAAMTTQFVYYPLRVNLCVPFIGSDDESIGKDDWRRMMLKLIEWAKLYGCSAVEALGRRGWTRVFRDIGFEESFVNIEREVSDGK